MERIRYRGRETALSLLLAAAVLLSALAGLRIAALKALAPGRQAAERFSGQSGKRYVQLSAFFHPREEVTAFQILLWNEALEGGMKASGIRPADAGSAFLWACSACSDLTVQSARGMFRLPAVGIDGSFFFFHPYRLLHGSLMQIPAGNGVVVSDRAAWMLFGAVNALGQPLLIGGEAYMVSGVVSLEDDRPARAALDGADCLIFVPYGLLGSGVTCYEAVLPEPVTGYGEALFSGLGTGSAVNNTARFSPSAIWRAILSLPAWSMVSSAAPLPYWENAARNAEMRIILWTMLRCFLLLPASAALFLLLLLPRAWRFLRGAGRRKAKRKETPP